MPVGRLRAERMRRDELAVVSAKLADRPTGAGLEGAMAPATWDPTNNVAAIQIGDTAASFDDDIDQELTKQYPMLTTQPGDAYGPTGGERAVLVQTQSGGMLILHHGQDDAPNVPAGERWIVHRSAQTPYPDPPTWDAFFKHTNDGPTPGDQLGGAHYGGNAAQSQLTTKAGWTLKFNDTGKLGTVTSPGGHTVTVDDNAATQGVTVQTAGGLVGHFNDVSQQITHIAAGTVSSPNVYTIVDGAGNAISHVVASGGMVGLGALASSLTANDFGAINHTILNTFGSNINAANLQTLINHCHAMVSAGIPNASNLLPLLVASLIDNVTVPLGSEIVRVAS